MHMSYRYEAVVVFDPGLSDADVATQIEKIDAIVKSHDGSIEKQEVWGRRELAYKIQKKTFGIYAVIVFTGDHTLVSDLRRQLRINDSVLRALIVDKDQYAPDMLQPPRPDAPPFRERGSDSPEGEGDEAGA